MRKLYFVITAIFVGLTILLSLPAVALMAVVVTFGTAAILLPTILVTTIALVFFLPVILVWPRKRLLLPALAVSLGGLLLAFGIPNNSAQKQAEQFLAEAPQTPAQPIAGDMPRTVEIIRSRSPDPDLGDAVIGRDLCDQTCQSLLLGGSIDWIRIRLTDDAFGNSGTKTTARFALASTLECRTFYSTMPDDTPCIVFRDDTKELADLVIEIQENQWKSSWGEGDFGDVTPAGKRVVQARFGPENDAPIAFLRTQLFYQIPSQRLAFNIGSLGYNDGGGGFKYVLEKGKGPAIRIPDELKALGIPLANPFKRTKPAEGQEHRQVPPDPWQSAMAASLFATSPVGDEFRHKWANAKTWHINDWLFMARAFDTLSAPEMHILCLAKTDERMNHISWLNQIESKQGSLDCP